MIRLFVGLSLPERIIQGLRFLEGGIESARWQRADQLHLSLRFIGEVGRDQADDIDATLSGIRFSPFDVALKGFGTFGRPGKPHVLWVGTDDDRQLVHLHNKIDQALIAASIAPENRRFMPHVTLARLKNSNAREILEYLDGRPEPKFQPFAATGFTLYSSRLGREGSTYEVLETYAASQTP